MYGFSLQRGAFPAILSAPLGIFSFWLVIVGGIANRMAIRIKSRGGETVEQMMRRFKKLCEKEGLTKDIKRKQYYEKPSERMRRSKRKSVRRVTPVT